MESKPHSRSIREREQDWLGEQTIEELRKAIYYSLRSPIAADDLDGRKPFLALERLVEQLEAAREALAFYADEKTWTQPTSWGGRILDDEGPWLSDTGRRAREALNPASRPCDNCTCGIPEEGAGPWCPPPSDQASAPAPTDPVDGTVGAEGSSYAVTNDPAGVVTPEALEDSP